ncbi:MAG: hypothetical protein H6R05_115 [Burkholderiaceae bacterium]|nr:hypothetical protein [Burkholderiaceae bacterium]
MLTFADTLSIDKPLKNEGFILLLAQRFTTQMNKAMPESLSRILL